MDFPKAIDAAFKRTNHLLFTRRSTSRWRNYAILTILTASSAGGGYHMSLPSSPPKAPTGVGHLSGSPFAAVDPHTLMILGMGALVGVAVFLALGVLLSWFGAICRLVMVEDIVYDREAILEPVGRLQQLGTSYFLFTIGWALALLIPFGVVTGALAATLGPHLAEQAQHGNVGPLLVALGTGMLVMLPFGLALSCWGTFCDELVVPLMYRENIKALAAVKMVWGMVRRQPGQWFLFWLVHVVLGAVGGMLVLTVWLLLTGCSMLMLLVVASVPGFVVIIAGEVSTGLGVIGTIWLGGGVIVSLTLLLLCFVPLIVFKRCFSIYCLQSFDPQLEMLPDNGRYVLDLGASAESPSVPSAQAEDLESGWTRASDW